MTDIVAAFGNQTITTAVAAPKKPPALYVGLLATTMAFAAPTTATAMPQIPQAIVAQSWTSTTQASVRPTDHSGSVRRLKNRSGLSWQQLGDAFGVSRRSLHFWVNGGNMAAANVQRLQHLSDHIAGMGDLKPTAVQAELLRPDATGRSQLDTWISQAKPARIAPPSSVADQFDLVHDTTQHRRSVMASDAAPIKLKDF